MKFPERWFVSSQEMGLPLVVVPGGRSSGIGVERATPFATSGNSRGRRTWGVASRATPGRWTGRAPTAWLRGRDWKATVAIRSGRGRERGRSPFAIRGDRRRGKIGFVLNFGMAKWIALQLAFGSGVVGSGYGKLRLFDRVRWSSGFEILSLVLPLGRARGQGRSSLLSLF